MNLITFWLTLVGTGCWVVSFGWMYRISSKQNKVLEQLRRQAERIEKVSQAEHDLIKEVHPQVAVIKDTVEQIATNSGP